MREIKFRVWIGGAFSYWGFVRFPAHARQLSFCGMPTNNKDPLTLEELQERSQQFTGLLDKNGKEIYEGDILSFDFNEDDAPIVWRDGGFWVRISDSPVYAGPRWLVPSPDSCEVVGNIYENPELLK